jgi:ATP synthase protein I
VLARLREREQAEQAARRHSRHLEVQVLRELIAPRREAPAALERTVSEAPPRLRRHPAPGPSRARLAAGRAAPGRPAPRHAARASHAAAPALGRGRAGLADRAAMLGGLALGRWLDQRLGSGITFSAALLLLGLGLGAWAGWRWIHKP